MLYQLNNKVQVIPSMGSFHSGGIDEKVWDLKTGQQQPVASKPQKMGLQKIPVKKPGSGLPQQVDMAGPTPGQQVKLRSHKA